jgi:hypothetical protein
MRNVFRTWTVWLLLFGALSIGCRQRAEAPTSAAAPAGATASTTEARSVGDESASGANARSSLDRYDLGADERQGGHTLERHVARTDEQLRERLKREPGIVAASTYTDRDTAERVVARTLASRRPQVEAWLDRSGERPNLVLDYHDPDDKPIGRSLERGSKDVVPCQDAILVLRWTNGRNFYVLTTYPMAAS